MGDANIKSKINFIELAEKVIREIRQPLTQYQIWEISKQKGYDKLVSTTGKTPWQTIGARLYVDIKENPDTKFIKLQRPTRFFLKELAENMNIQDLEDVSYGLQKEAKKNFYERDLHKYLSYFVYNYGFIYTKTIYHEESNKKTYSQWLHPDIVGVYYPIEQWEKEVIDISKEIGSVGVKLFSYEIKKQLNFSNLRESYFQAVSNSSWANEGYLVAAEIDSDEEFQQEIKRLTNAFGIGIIKLDIDDPDSSEIIYPSKVRDILDIETMNKIAQVNDNFKEFLRRIKNDLATFEIRKEEYDKIYDIEELRNGKALKWFTVIK